VRSSIADRAFLVEQFVNLFEVAGMERAVRDDLRERGRAAAADRDGDFQLDVDRWLDAVLD
jgi:hypothetical protein